MYAALFFSVVGAIFAIPPIVAFSKNEQTIKNVCWSKGEDDFFDTSITDQKLTYTLYLGLNSVVSCSDPALPNHDACTVIDWNDNRCADTPFFTKDDCNKCEDATTSVYPTVILALIAQLGSIGTDIRRRLPETDMNCQKTLALVTGFIGFISSMSTAGTYLFACVQHLNDGNADWNSGPGFICLIFVIINKPLNAILHLLVPTPDHCRYDDDNLIQNDGNNAGKSSAYSSISQPDATQAL